MDNNKFLTKLRALRWRRIGLRLAPVDAQFGRQPHIDAVEAIIKGITESLGWRGDERGSNGAFPRVIYHQAGRGGGGDAGSLCIDVIICRADAQQAGQWVERCREYFNYPDNIRSYALAGIDDPVERGLDDIARESGALPQTGELCLKFLTPIPLPRIEGKPRTFITGEGFIRGMLRRLERLFGGTFEAPPELFSAFELLPYYWHYQERRRKSHSQKGHLQYVNGCVGPLYIKGNFAEIMPILTLGGELHAGSILSNAQGRYVLYTKPQKFFDLRFPDSAKINSVAEQVCRRYDDALLALSTRKGKPVSVSEAADSLVKAFADGSWRPSPSQAFKVNKHSGGERIVERLSFEDLIAQQYLKETIGPVVEKMLEESAVGYRRGLSREEAAKRIEEAARDGFRFVLEADIDDFFPSVDLNRLFQMLDRLFPSADAVTLNLLKQCLTCGFTLNGRLRERVNGLAQGSPLSPLLANLYLDAFDEDMQKLDGRLIRYADDFVILFKTEQQAEAAFAVINESLSALGLKLKKAKTDVKSMDEGFCFLGYDFKAGERPPEFKDDRALLKKPLFITEPFVFLGVNGDALTVVKDKKTLETIPLRRISGITTLAQATFSSSMLARCADNKIPVTISLGTGYEITTVKPDSKLYYEVAARHAQRYWRMDETERLSVAQAVARAKLRNSRLIFAQHYERGTNRILGRLNAAAEEVLECGSVEQIMGVEGAAAREVWKALAGLFKQKGFEFVQRRRVEPDRLNSLLNFGYYLLFSRLNALIRGEGLNPYLGFLHNPEDDYESLIADLQEPFRSRVDRFVLRMVNLKIITPAHFTESAKGFYLIKEGKGLFIQHYEAELNRAAGGESLSWIDLMTVQVASVKRWALDEGPVLFYEWKGVE